MIKLNCHLCPNRLSCTNLCPAAELYADQDNVPSKEVLLGEVMNSSHFVGSEWPVMTVDRGRVHLSDRQLSVFTLISAGIPREKVCKTLKLSRNQVRDCLHKIRNKFRQKANN